MNLIISNIRETFADRIFLRKITTIGIPVALQALLNTVVNMVDTIMIGQLGDVTIAAVGLANRVFFVFSLLIYGIVSGSSVLTAQYYGNSDIASIKKVLGTSLCLAIAGALFFFLPSFLIPQSVMRIFTYSEASINLGADYLHIVCIGYLFTAVSMIYIAIMRSIGRVAIAVISTCTAIVTNIFFNYMLIFGNFGAPAMGVKGAAIATVIARLVEMFLVLGIVYGTKSPVAARLREMTNHSKQLINQYIKTVTPVIFNEFFWGLGVTLYSLVYGRMGDNAAAAITVSQTLQDIFFVLFQGIGSAAGVILGYELGAGNMKKAESYAKKFIVLQLFLSIVFAMLCLILKGGLTSIYNVSPEVAGYVEAILIIFSFYLPVKMYNYLLIVGIYRCGGDTRFCFFVDASGVWLIGVPLAFISGLLLQLPVYTVYFLVTMEEVYKAVIVTIRYKKKKWLNNLAAQIK